MIKAFSSLLVITALLCSCKHEHTGDTVLPTVTIFTPTPNQQFYTGDTLRITGMCQDNEAIDEVPVRITDEDTRQQFFNNHYGSINNSVFNVNTYHVVATNATTKYSIIIAVKDVAGHTVQKEVRVNIN